MIIIDISKSSNKDLFRLYFYIYHGHICKQKHVNLSVIEIYVRTSFHTNKK